MTVRGGVLVRFGVVLGGVLAVLGFGSVSPVWAAQPWWQLSSSSAPAHLQPGPCEGFNEPQTLPQCGQVVVRAENLGDLSLSGSTTPVMITDVLPAGVRAIGIARVATGSGELLSNERGSLACSPSPPAMAFPAGGVTCTWAGPFALPPYEMLEVAIDVEVERGVSSGENEVAVSGGEGYACEKQEGGAFVTSFCAGATYGVPSNGSYEAHLTGREVAPASLRRPLTIGGPTLFGIEEYTFTNESEGGASDTQAGSHPFQQTTNIAFNQGTPLEGREPKEYIANPPALAKDLHLQWPAGLIGNTTVLPQCTEVQFSTDLNGGGNLCEADTAVGVASVTVALEHGQAEGLRTEEVPVFNLVPSRGEPARFGFEVQHTTVTIDPSVRTGSDYGITVNVENIDQIAVFVASRVTVWGVPGNPSHDDARGWGCMQGGAFVRESSIAPCTPEGERNPPAFLSLPTSCTGPLRTSVEADSWQEPDNVLKYGPSVPMPALEGCSKLLLSASLEASPDMQWASTPTGLTVKVHVPQEASLAGEGLSVPAVKDTTVTLPEGITTNPAGANGLEACSEGLVGFTGFEELNKELEAGVKTATFTPKLPGSLGSSEKLEAGVNFCPNASKIATAKITVPVLTHPLEGAVYLASQNANPFGSLVAMYIVAEDPVSGVLVKLAGEVKLNPETGQIVSTFENTPQAPFEELELNFFGGERAPLATPAYCRDNTPSYPGLYTTNASFTPWSGTAPASSSSSFAITSGPNGGPCPGPSLPFAPSFAGGTTNLQASAFSDLDTIIGREDGNQALQSVQLHFPPGLTGLLSGVKLCDEAQANAGICPQESKIGETTASVGIGGDPYTVTGGEVFITEKYKGAPFGLSIVTPAVAGPYNLGKVIVRAKIEINPTTAALTVTTNSTGPYAIPHILDGIPLGIKHVAVTINRPDFTINPTNCTPMSITGTLGSSEGSSSPVTVPFQVSNCATLAFAPKFSVTTSARTSKANGASLVSRLSYPNAPQGSQANIAKVKVDLPEQLPSRLTTLQKACLAAVFETNPASCPPDSIVGHATVHTPLLPVPLTGPAYFVSHGGEAFPSLTMVLQGYGVTIELVGSTFIHDGITSTTFKATPDNPFSAFELVLPEGEYSALTANANLCQSKLKMPTLFVAQNGAEIHETTTIQTEGCPDALAITSHVAKNHTVTLTVAAPAAGKLTATGKHLTKVATTAKGRETLKLRLKATKAGKLTTTIKLTLTPTAGKKLTTTLTTHLNS